MSESRFAATPPTLGVRLVDDGFERFDVDALGIEADRESIREAGLRLERANGEPSAVPDLAAEADIPEGTVRKRLADVEDWPEGIRPAVTGAGKRGDPRRFSFVSSPANLLGEETSGEET